MTQASSRLASVDAFRALTMFLMIFVNDLWSVSGAPEWLDHAGMLEDRLGLADTVFPAFLFILGLSIPFAVKARASKGYSSRSTLIHILTRSLALLVMGVYHVNLESYNKAEALLPKPWWQIGITIGFFLVWLDYPRKKYHDDPLSGEAPTGVKSTTPGWLKGVSKKNILQGCGILLLALMALLYKGGSPEHPRWMRLSWYGILGLIGWCYLLCAVIYLYAKGRWSLLIGALIFFLGLSIADKAGWLDFLDPIRHYAWILSSGALPTLTMAGVLTAVLFRQAMEKGQGPQSLLIIGVLALVSLGAGFALRPLGGISKIRATPSWVLICTAISMGCFVLLAFFMDIKGHKNWFALIRPAGTSTLTCYLLPYIHYAIFNFPGLSNRLPLVLRTGGIGIVKSLIYSLLIILVTGLLEKRKIRLSV
jgi:heparan-alpha-glucosaminide N-acetyltransferase